MRIGDHIPDFTLPDQDWNNVSTLDLIGDPLVIYFYPKDDTPGCTKQACSFRDQYHVFEEAGATVLGVSSDTPEEHRSFQSKHRLPFKLLSDKKGNLRKKFGVESHLLGLIPGRETFIFDKSGKLVHRFNSQTRATQHITEAIEALQEV
ncbi:MAG: peroxiredoxin [Salibacteraceae bacterium]